MGFKKSIFFFFLFLNGFAYSQTGLSLYMGASPWRFAHNYNDISSPISLAYSGGLQLEQSIARNGFGLLTGVDYVYAQPGTLYADLTDKMNADAVAFEEQINKNYINVIHHEVTLPLMMVFYHNGLRTSIGASYSRYYFENPNNSGTFRIHDDYGLKAITGARVSKRVIFSIGYYYGLNDVLNLKITDNENGISSSLKGNMQQIKVHFAISLFNTMKETHYFLGDKSIKKPNSYESGFQ